MDELHRYLKSLGIPIMQPKIDSASPEPPHPAPFPNSQSIHHPFGTVYVINENTSSPKTNPLKIPGEIIKWSGFKHQDENFSISDFLFVDVETSGEYGGAGVICFLVGIGKVSDQEIHLSQYLILHPEDELAQLIELEKIFLSAKGFLTYNGKSFDLPLLDSRFQYHQIPLPTREGLHIDLLLLSRKIWKNHSPNRALRTMEATVLGIERSVEDVPGWLIPSLFRDFLLTKDASFLNPVLYHNKMDVLSMVHLYFHIADLFTNPLERSKENAEIHFCLASFYQSIGEIDRAIEAFETCLPYLPEASQRIALSENLASLYKHQKRYQNAIEKWQEAASLGSLSAHLELAKYYEHLQKDLNTARRWVEAASKLLEDNKKMDRFTRTKWQTELQYRLDRLNKKSFPRQNERK
ncbi:MAG: hypothetical protein D6735_15460 [Acidobacteria bacterium]|nr:MAG: hypothetical protein D6735_15460 [Acidobacteriota bacterium]